MENPITQFRKARKMSRAEMSRQSGIYYNTLTVLEYGKPEAMQRRTLESLSAFTEIMPEQIQADYANWRLEKALERA